MRLDAFEVDKAIRGAVPGDVLMLGDGAHWEIFSYKDELDLYGEGWYATAHKVEFFEGGEFDSRIRVTIRIGSQYFTKIGRSVSHDGDHWDGPMFESRPRTRTITEYEAI